MGKFFSVEMIVNVEAESEEEAMEYVQNEVDALQDDVENHPKFCAGYVMSASLLVNDEE